MNILAKEQHNSIHECIIPTCQAEKESRANKN